MKMVRMVCIVLLLASGSALAQDSDSWDWKITPYLWTVGIDGDLAIGPIDQEIDVSFSDILDDLDFGGSVYAELGKGRHSVHLDYTYLRLKPDPTALPTPPFPMDSTLSTKMTINVFEPAYNYRFEGPGSWALVLGARHMDIEMKMTPDISLPEPIPGLPIEDGVALEAGPDWWDYFVGLKTNNRISANWDFLFYGTVGGGGSHLPWTLQATFGRRYSNDNRLHLGLRVWGIDYSKSGGAANQLRTIDATFSGLVVGYEFN